MIDYLNSLACARDCAQQRRDRNRAAGACVNETRDGTHGPATHGCRCERCYEVHKHGARAARSS